MQENNRILIIDDEPKLARSLALVLKLNKYVVTTAPDASTALLLLRSDQYGLVFLDVRLPDQSGIQMIPQIHAIRPDTPIVMLTADATLDSALASVQAGAIDYLLKPVNPEDILSKVKDILENGGQPKNKQSNASKAQTWLSQLADSQEKKGHEFDTDAIKPTKSF